MPRVLFLHPLNLDSDMRLLRTDISKGFILDNFDVEKAPPYAILSHRWSDNEVLLRDLTSDGPKDGARFDKIIGCCKQARKDGFTHVWIDTCCINQESSAELSESINSMFLWYTKAARCCVHLHDVSSKQDPESKNSAFRASKWFTRGWTLQELIAPRDLVFFTQEWNIIGNKLELAGTIEEITKIGYGALCNCVELTYFSVAERMSWASNRETTKVEDRAYSLLGIFGVHMTTIYGEGLNSFERLQYEIITHSNDYSIFAWDVYTDIDLRMDRHLPVWETCGLLAPSPDSFANSAGILSTPFPQFSNEWCYQETVVDIQRANTGIRLKVPIFEPSPSTSFTRRDACIMAIACKTPRPSSSTIGVVLQLDSQGYYNRLETIRLHDADGLTNFGGQWKIDTINVRSASRRNPVSSNPPEIFAHLFKTYQVVLKSPMLNKPRNSPISGSWKGFTFDSYHCQSDSWVPSQSYRDEGPHQYRWVEDPKTKQSNLIVQISCLPDNTPGQDEHRQHTFVFSWLWDGMEINFEIRMQHRGLVSCDGIRLKNWRGFDTGLIYGVSAQRGDYYWSVDVPERGTMGIRLTMTDVMADVVRYELDLMIHASRSKMRIATDSTVITKMRGGISLKRFFQKPVHWVPACLGTTPQGAYVSHKGYFSTPTDEKYHIARARHEGMLKPGILEGISAWAVVPSFDDFNLHAVCDYEVLVATSDQLDWVKVQGPFKLETLKGANPVVLGGDRDESSLYVARRGSWDKRNGMVRIGSRARLIDLTRIPTDKLPTVEDSDEYEVLVYRN